MNKTYVRVFIKKQEIKNYQLNVSGTRRGLPAGQNSVENGGTATLIHITSKARIP
jgi:hypothetical protein